MHRPHHGTCQEITVISETLGIHLPKSLLIVGYQVSATNRPMKLTCGAAFPLMEAGLITFRVTVLLVGNFIGSQFSHILPSQAFQKSGLCLAHIRIPLITSAYLWVGIHGHVHIMAHVWRLEGN